MNNTGSMAKHCADGASPVSTGWLMSSFILRNSFRSSLSNNPHSLSVNIQNTSWEMITVSVRLSEKAETVKRSVSLKVKPDLLQYFLKKSLGGRDWKAASTEPNLRICRMSAGTQRYASPGSPTMTFIFLAKKVRWLSRNCWIDVVPVLCNPTCTTSLRWHLGTFSWTLTVYFLSATIVFEGSDLAPTALWM